MKLVLIVDDQRIIGDVLRIFLEEHAEVKVVSRHFEDLLSHRSPQWDGVNILVCDVWLQSPVSGIDILQTARDFYPHIRRVALTNVHPADERYSQAKMLSHAIIEKTMEYSEIARIILGE